MAFQQPGALPGSNAVAFNNGYIQYTTNFVPPLLWTVEFLINPTAYQGAQIIMYNVLGDAAIEIQLGDGSAPVLSISDSTDTNQYLYLPAITFSLGAWHHLAITYDPVGTQTALLYLNGVLAGSVATTYQLAALPVTRLYIGSNSLIQDVAFYNKVLTGVQAAAHHTAVTA